MPYSQTLEQFQGWWFHFLGSLYQCLTTFSLIKFFLVLSINLSLPLLLQLKATTSCPVTFYLGEELLYFNRRTSKICPEVKGVSFRWANSEINWVMKHFDLVIKNTHTPSFPSLQSLNGFGMNLVPILGTLSIICWVTNIFNNKSC